MSVMGSKMGSGRVRIRSGEIGRGSVREPLKGSGLG